MADSATTPAVKNTVELEADVNVEFNEAASRQQINSGESVKTLFGKLRKFLADLKAVAFSGAYSDLSGAPDLTQYALKSKYGDTTIDVGRKSGTTVGDYSTAEGYNTIASGKYSTADGWLATASGQGSKASGYNTEALGDYSCVGGFYSQSLGHSSFAYGNRARTSKNNEVAFGIFNISNDDTLFSVGDGKADNGKHNAFEITTTGGKLHDKDIATTDKIPDLSEYAKKTDVPNIKVNSAGNADTVSSLRHNEYYIDIFSTSLTSEHPCWNKICYVWGQSVDSGAENFINNAPESNCFAVWYEVETIGVSESRGYQIAHGCYKHQRKTFIRYVHDGVWSDWTEMYTSGNKPYVTGSATVAANNTTCVSNHGFTPSAVIWWDGNSSGVAVSFNDTQFVIDKTSSVGKTINYLIFK